VGDVVEKTMLVIKVRTVKNEEITVPNSTVLSSNTVNYSAMANDQGLIIHTTVTIGYDVPWRLMHQALIRAAEKTEAILKDPAPFVLQTSLDDFYVSYQLNAYTRAAREQPAVYSALHQNIQDSCNEAGIEIMSPHYQNLRDGNRSTIPADYLPKQYEAPPFYVRQSEQRKADPGGTVDPDTKI
jgi:small-conductance mechanosensitive channel